MAKNSNNIQGVLFLRNGSLYTDRTEARQEIVANQGLVGDGEFILARYIDGNSEVQTLVGVKYHGTGGDYLTIIDMEGASADVEKLREEINAKLGGGVSSANTVTAQLTALSGNSSTDTSATTSVEGAKKYADDLIGTLDYADEAVTGSYVSKVDQADGVISVTREELPTVAAISEAGKPIIAVAEDKGQIAASAGTINAEFVNVTGDTFTATTVQGALEELDDKIDNVVDGLDYTGVTTGTGVYVTNVTEEDGKVSATTATLPTVDDTAVAKNFVIAVDETLGEISVERGSITSSAETIVLTDNADGGVNFEVNIDNDTIVQDETSKKLKVASAALTQYVGDGKTIEISAADEHNNKTVSTLLTLSSVTPSSTTVKEEYALKNASGETIGSTIKIYKDSHIVSITYITDPSDEHYQNLEYVYIDADGETQTEYVDISALVLEAEFASGVTVTNHVAHGVVDPTSETFLTVGADGFKLAGVQDAIDAAYEALDADESGSTTHITVNVVEEDGVITAVNVEEDNIADADDLAQEILDRQAGDDALDARLGAGVTSANTAAAQLAALSGTNESLSGETSVEGAKRYADAKLAEVVADLDATVSGESTHVNVEVSEENGVITAVTVVEDKIADADDLAELSGKTITAITSTNGSISASISDAVGNKTADIETDASKIKMSGFTSTDALSGITSSSSITEAFKEVDAVITEDERVTAAALNDLNEKVSGLSENSLSGVSVNGHAVTVANNVAPIVIEGSTSAATPTSTEAIVVDTDDNGNVTLGLGYIDCGTY